MRYLPLIFGSMASELRVLRSFTKPGWKSMCERIRLPCFGNRRNMVRYTASQSSDGMAGIEGSLVGNDLPYHSMGDGVKSVTSIR